jgi:hypothetical protein
MSRLAIGWSRLPQLFSKLCLELGAPRAGLRLLPNGVHASQVAPGAAAMAARQIVATSEDGGYHCCQFSSCDRSFFTIVNHQNFYKQYHSCCPWRLCSQVAASQ